MTAKFACVRWYSIVMLAADPFNSIRSERCVYSNCFTSNKVGFQSSPQCLNAPHAGQLAAKCTVAATGYPADFAAGQQALQMRLLPALLLASLWNASSALNRPHSVHSLVGGCAACFLHPGCRLEAAVALASSRVQALHRGDRPLFMPGRR